MCTTHAREGHVRRKDECFSCWLGKGKPAVGFSFCMHGKRRHRCQLCPGKSPVPPAMTHIPNDTDRPSSFTAATATSEATEIETEALVAHRRQHKRPRPCEGFRAARAHPEARDVIYGNNGVPVYAELELRSTQESLRVLQLELCRLQPTQQDLVSAPVNGRGDRVLIKIPSYTKKGRRWVEEPFVSALKSFMVASIGCRREVLTMLSAMNKEHDTSTAKYIFTGCLYIAPNRGQVATSRGRKFIPTLRQRGPRSASQCHLQSYVSGRSCSRAQQVCWSRQKQLHLFSTKAGCMRVRLGLCRHCPLFPISGQVVSFFIS